MAKPEMGDELLDAEFAELFSVFDEVSAPADLKSSTLELIAALPEAGAAQSLVESTGDSSFTASKGGKASRRRPSRASRRAFRVAAVAACMAFALVGGVAYATPTSYMALSQGDAVVELGINRFDVSVSALSDDEVGQSIIDSTPLVNVSYQDALTGAADAFEAVDPTGTLALLVESDDEAQRERLESGGNAIVADRNEARAARLNQGDSGEGAKDSGKASSTSDDAEEEETEATEEAEVVQYLAPVAAEEAAEEDAQTPANDDADEPGDSGDEPDEGEDDDFGWEEVQDDSAPVDPIDPVDSAGDDGSDGGSSDGADGQDPVESLEPEQQEFLEQIVIELDDDLLRDPLVPAGA